MKGKKLSTKSSLELGAGGLLNNYKGMAYDYNDRKVARYGENGSDLIVDTAYTTDTGFFETGVIDTRYTGDSDMWIIVDEYKTKPEAEKTHAKWVKLLTGRKLPFSLEDVHSGEVFKLGEK